MAPYVRAHRCKPCRTSLSEIAGRLALTRRVLDLTRFQLARLLGADMPARGAYEAGLERIPADQAAQALRRPGIQTWANRVADLRPEAGEASIGAFPARSGAPGSGRLKIAPYEGSCSVSARQSPAKLLGPIAIRHSCHTLVLK